MDQLKLAVSVIEIIMGVMALLLLGDYLGYKISRRRLVAICGFVALVIIVAFAIYAAIVLA